MTWPYKNNGGGKQLQDLKEVRTASWENQIRDTKNSCIEIRNKSFSQNVQAGQSVRRNVGEYYGVVSDNQLSL